MGLGEGSLLDYSLITIIGYCILSTGEWIIHRYLMHVASFPVTQAFIEICNRHVTHHNLTEDDMSLNPFDKIKSKQKQKSMKIKFGGLNVMKEFQGLFFLWPATILVFIMVNSGNLIINYLFFKCNFYYVFIYGTLLVIYESAMWNAMHPMLHLEKRKLYWNEGIDFIDRKWLENTYLYKWLWHNHVLHHLITGKEQGNFNVTLPFADFVLGTYNSKAKQYIINSSNFTVIKI